MRAGDALGRAQGGLRGYIGRSAFWRCMPQRVHPQSVHHKSTSAALERLLERVREGTPEWNEINDILCERDFREWMSCSLHP